MAVEQQSGSQITLLKGDVCVATEISCKASISVREELEMENLSSR